MIETYNILHGIYDAAVAPDVSIYGHYQDSVTRGNSLRSDRCDY